jgi:hypothetical protein
MPMWWRPVAARRSVMERQAEFRDDPGDRVVGPGRDDDRAVDETAAQVAGHAFGVAGRVDDQVDHLVVRHGEDLVGAQHDGADVGVVEQQ